MEWSKRISESLQLFHKEPPCVLSREALLPFWDVTNLQENCDEASLAMTFANAKMDSREQTRLEVQFAPVVCVYPKWVSYAVKMLAHTPTKVATVVNFPYGNAPQQAVGIQLEEAIADGASEIDVVFPYQAFLAGDKEQAYEFVSYCKSLCGSALLKVILETGAFSDAALIAEAAILVAECGADFIKTSTGKIAIGATFEAAVAILVAITEVRAKCSQMIGLKVSGGIRSVQAASQYHLLAATLMGEKWLTPRHFRIGASQLLV